MAFNEYMISDCDIDELRSEVIRIDDQVSRELGVSRDFMKDSETDNAMAGLYTAIAAKYKINADYKDFKSFIHGIVEESRLESTINEALSSKVVASLAKRTQLRLIISMAYLIEKASKLIESQVQSADVVTPELVTMIDRMGEWFARMQEMIDTQKLVDPDRAIDRALQNDKREHPEKYIDQVDTGSMDISSQSSEGDMKIIQMLLASME